MLVSASFFSEKYVLGLIAAPAPPRKGRGTGSLAPQKKLAVARVFPNVSVAMCPSKTLFGPLLATLIAWPLAIGL